MRLNFKYSSRGSDVKVPPYTALVVVQHNTALDLVKVKLGEGKQIDVLVMNYVTHLWNSS